MLKLIKLDGGVDLFVFDKTAVCRQNMDYKKEMSFPTVQLLRKRLARFFFSPQNIIEIQFYVFCMTNQYPWLKNIVSGQFACIIVNRYRKTCVVPVSAEFCICIMFLCVIHSKTIGLMLIKL